MVLVNTFGIVGTAAAALVIDRMGRIKSLMTSFIIQGIALFLVPASIRTAELHSSVVKATTYGTAAAPFVFIFLFFFTMFNIVPCWIYSTEIWPQEIRGKGYSFTILGWATGYIMNTFVIPIMLSRLGWKTFIIFGCFNIIAMPIIWFMYPEPANKTLEEVEFLFISYSLLISKNMAEYRRLVDEAGGNIAVAERRLLDSVDAEFAETVARAMSYAAQGGKMGSHVEEKSL